MRALTERTKKAVERKKRLDKRPKPLYTESGYNAGLAQLVAQLICNHQVGGSNPSAGTIKKFPPCGEFFYGTDKTGDLNPTRALSVLENRLNACFQRSGAEPKTKRQFCLSLSRHHKKTLPCGAFFYALDFPRKEKAPPKQEGAFFCFGRRLRIRTADPLGVNEML